MVKFYLDIVRNQKNMSVRELSELSGISTSHIENIEAGRANPSVEVMCKLSQVLETPVYDLFRCEHES